MTASLYPASYFIGHAYADDPRRKAMKAQEAARIKARLSVASGSVLDVGCGIGDFLAEHFAAWEKFGTEVSEYAFRQAAKRGIRAVDAGIPMEWDLVVWRGTFQHLDEPMGMLRECIEEMKPGALIAFLATPNTNSLVYKLFGDLPALDAPRNFVIPSDKMLANILKNLGLKDIEVVKPYWGTPYANPVMDLVKFVLRLFGVKVKFAWPGSMMEIYARK
ncbi:MAG: class I SAM-dependent methyltransferase [Anaerolineales bacterium]|nr:MAG: class I SAM-dependent methyltransferase [Anaerolineales bacterium]